MALNPPQPSHGAPWNHINHSLLLPARSSPGFWTRLRMSVRRRRNNGVLDDQDFGQVRLPTTNASSDKPVSHWTKATRACLLLPLLILSFLVVHILDLSFGYLSLLRHYNSASYLVADNAVSEWTALISDATRHVTPVQCHSHNDYWRKVPLYDALRWGCTGVEADVWLNDGELLVGHSIGSLAKEKTLRSMYVDPLVKLLDHRNSLSDNVTSSSTKNGVFQTAPGQTLVLLIDLKSNGQKTFPHVSHHLRALREKGYLSYYDGASFVENAITVVATGDTPFDLVTANSTYRDIFFDAPLDRLHAQPSSADVSLKGTEIHQKANMHSHSGQGNVGTTAESHFDSTNSYYASVNFGRSIGWLWFGRMTKAQRALIRGQIQDAHERGLKPRYWSTPRWPVGLRNEVWRILMEENVDYLNGDDLHAMTSLAWSRKEHGH